MAGHICLLNVFNIITCEDASSTPTTDLLRLISFLSLFDIGTVVNFDVTTYNKHLLINIVKKVISYKKEITFIEKRIYKKRILKTHTNT